MVTIGGDTRVWQLSSDWSVPPQCTHILGAQLVGKLENKLVDYLAVHWEFNVAFTFHADDTEPQSAVVCAWTLDSTELASSSALGTFNIGTCATSQHICNRRLHICMRRATSVDPWQLSSGTVRKECAYMAIERCRARTYRTPCGGGITNRWYI